jgi:hypothetical protein
VDEALLERIVHEHLLADQPVEAHIFHRLGAAGAVLDVTILPARLTTAATPTKPTRHQRGNSARRRGDARSGAGRAQAEALLIVSRVR